MNIPTQVYTAVKTAFLALVITSVAYSSADASKRKRYNTDKLFDQYDREETKFLNEYRRYKKHFSDDMRIRWKGIDNIVGEAKSLFHERLEEYNEIRDELRELKDDVDDYIQDVKEATEEKKNEIYQIKKTIKKAQQSANRRKDFSSDVFRGASAIDYDEYGEDLHESGITFPYEDSTFSEYASANEKKAWADAEKSLQAIESKLGAAKWNFKVAEQAQNTPVGRAKRDTAQVKAMENLFQVFELMTGAEVVKTKIRYAVAERRMTEKQDKIIQNAEGEFKDALKRYVEAKSKMIETAKFAKDRVPLEIEFKISSWSSVSNQATAELLYELKQAGVQHIYFPGVYFEESHKFVVANELSKSISTSFSNLNTEFSNKVLYPSPDLRMDMQLIDGQFKIASQGTFRNKTAIIVGEMVKISNYICLNLRAVDLESAKIIKSLLYLLNVDEELKSLLHDTAFARVSGGDMYASEVRFQINLDDEVNFIGGLLKDAELNGYSMMLDRDMGIPRESKRVGFVLLKHLMLHRTPLPLYDFDFLVKALPLEQGVTHSMLKKSFPVTHRWFIDPTDNKQIIKCQANNTDTRLGQLRLRKLGGY